MVGADSAFTRAVALRGQCADDVSTWRRFYWVPVLNAGVAAWQSGDTDSAIASFQRANAIYRDEPQGLLYIAVLYANSDQADSAVKYFQAGIKAAGSDTTFATEKKEATFNLARVYHRAERWDEAAATYRAYLADNPNDVEATAALASIQSIRGQSDSAAALYAAVLDRADAVSFRELLQAGISIFRGAPPEPDSAVVRRACGAPARRACRDSLEARHDSLSRETYRLAGRAFEAVLTKNPHYRDALFNLANVVYQLRDTVRLLPVAQRLVAADPLNRSANLLLAHGYQFAGKGDSALHYLEVADDGLPAELTVTNLRLDERAASVAGLVANFHDRPTPALTLVFEFLDTGGKVIATQTLQVPGLPAKENYSFTVQAAGQGIVAYRYRTS
jgi:tetratricopeptide (TPR) repeat protein